MEFTISCPIDGQVTVSLEDIDTVVLKDSESADITFVCPHCGTAVTMSAAVPRFLLAAIEALAEEGGAVGGPFAGVVHVVSESQDAVSPPEGGVDDALAEAYCEYFRRQLAHVDCVEDALHEIDAAR